MQLLALQNYFLQHSIMWAGLVVMGYQYYELRTQHCIFYFSLVFIIFLRNKKTFWNYHWQVFNKSIYYAYLCIYLYKKLKEFVNQESCVVQMENCKYSQIIRTEGIRGFEHEFRMSQASALLLLLLFFVLELFSDQTKSQHGEGRWARSPPPG